MLKPGAGPTQVTYSHEFNKRLRAGLIGCGGHAYRNIVPVFQYVPVDLVAVCDLRRERADHFKTLFGAQKAYEDYREMIRRGSLDAVFIVTGYDERGHVLYPLLAASCLTHGLHVWIEKPPVNCFDDVKRLRVAMRTSGKKLAVGFKKAFAPANRRLKALTEAREFGAIGSISIRYPQRIPTTAELAYEGTDGRRYGPRVSFLDHLCHPVSLLQFLGGRSRSLFYARARNGAGSAVLNLRSGATAALHFPFPQSRNAPLERTEISGDEANIVVENGVRLTYYRRTKRKGHRRYGRSSDFTGSLDDAPVTWEPEWSLGTLYNKALFLLGYYDEIAYFCDAVLHRRPIEVGGLEYVEEGIRIYEAFKRGPDRLITLRGTTMTESASEKVRKIGGAWLATKEAARVETFEWGRISWMVSSTQGNCESMTFGEVVIHPGRSNPRHSHPNCDEVLHLLSGRVEYSAGAETFLMNPGDTVVIPKDVVHNARAVGASEAVMVIAFSSAHRKTKGE